MSPQSRTPAYRSPDWRPPLAPGALAPTHALILTRNTKTGLDEIADPEAMQAWLRRQPLLPKDVPVDQELFQQVLVLRDGLHDLVLARYGASFDVDGLNREMGTLRFEVRVGADGPQLRVPHKDTASVLADGFVAALNEDNWTRFKLCSNPECGWIFYDDSKYKTRKWCLLERCGAPLHVRRSRHRKTIGSPRR